MVKRWSEYCQTDFWITSNLLWPKKTKCVFLRIFLTDILDATFNSHFQFIVHSFRLPHHHFQLLTVFTEKALKNTFYASCPLL